MKIYTDGSCIGNPGPGGWAWWCQTTKRQAFGYEGHTTNNIMELRAIYEAVRALEDGRSVLIHSDSQLSINVLTKRWKAKKNRDLIESIWDLPYWPCVRLHWVRGHSGQHGNELVDRLANTAARSQTAWPEPMGTVE